MRRFCAALLCCLLPLTAAAQSADARNTAWEIVKKMKRFSEIARRTGLGENALTDAELDAYEPKLATILDEDNQKAFICGPTAMALVMDRTMRLHPMMAGEMDPIEQQNPALNWLGWYAQVLAPSVISGSMTQGQATRIINYECNQLSLERLKEPY